MGENSTPVVCMIVLCAVLLCCEALPFIANANPTTLNGESSHSLHDHRRAILNMESSHSNNHTLELKEFIRKRNLTRVSFYKNVILFTKKLVSHLFRLGENIPHNNAKVSNVIETPNNKERKYNTETLLQQRDKIQDNSQQLIITTTKATKNIVKKDSDSVNGPLLPPGGHRFVPGHRKRQRRSFLHEYGLALSYSDDDGDVIFGAHTSPCAYKDRHYCLNGGTCIFVGALEIKTCQCKIGYTGLRCQSINQEFLMALLSEELFG